MSYSKVFKRMCLAMVIGRRRKSANKIKIKPKKINNNNNKTTTTKTPNVS